jgi:hypothetical protein
MQTFSNSNKKPFMPPTLKSGEVAYVSKGKETFSNLIYKKPFMPHTWELLFESSHPQIRGGS